MAKPTGLKSVSLFGSLYSREPRRRQTHRQRRRWHRCVHKPHESGAGGRQRSLTSSTHFGGGIPGGKDPGKGGKLVMGFFLADINALCCVNAAMRSASGMTL